MLTKVLFSVLCWLAVANASEDYNYDVLDDLLSTEVAVVLSAEEYNAQYIIDVESKAQMTISEDQPCDHPNALHNDQMTNMCHFIGNTVQTVFSMCAPWLTALGLMGILLKMFVPCAVQIGVKLCLGDRDIGGLAVEFLTCSLCKLCKQFIPDYFCNVLGDVISGVLSDMGAASAIETKENALETEAETQIIFFWKVKQPVVAAYKCVFDRAFKLWGPCGKIFNYIKAVFDHDYTPEDTGEGNGSNAPRSGCKLTMPGVNKIVDLIFGFLLTIGECGTCLYEAVFSLFGKGSGKGSGKKVKKKGMGSAKSFGLLTNLLKLFTQLCCIKECSCWFESESCSEGDENFPEKPWPEWAHDYIEGPHFKKLSARQQNAWFKANGFISA